MADVFVVCLVVERAEGRTLTELFRGSREECDAFMASQPDHAVSGPDVLSVEMVAGTPEQWSGVGSWRAN